MKEEKSLNCNSKICVQTMTTIYSKLNHINQNPCIFHTNEDQLPLSREALCSIIVFNNVYHCPLLSAFQELVKISKNCREP